jgi:hypothetical protein
MSKITTAKYQEKTYSQYTKGVKKEKRTKENML